MSENSVTPPGMDIAHQYTQSSDTSQSNVTSNDYVEQTLTACLESHRPEVNIHVSVFDSINGNNEN